MNKIATLLSLAVLAMFSLSSCNLINDDSETVGDYAWLSPKIVHGGKEAFLCAVYPDIKLGVNWHSTSSANSAQQYGWALSEKTVRGTCDSNIFYMYGDVCGSMPRPKEADQEFDYYAWGPYVDSTASHGENRSELTRIGEILHYKQGSNLAEPIDLIYGACLGRTMKSWNEDDLRVSIPVRHMLCHVEFCVASSKPVSAIKVASAPSAQACVEGDFDLLSGDWTPVEPCDAMEWTWSDSMLQRSENMARTSDEFPLNLVPVSRETSFEVTAYDATGSIVASGSLSYCLIQGKKHVVIIYGDGSSPKITITSF